MRTRHRHWIAPLIVGTVSISACGSDSNSTATTEGGQPTSSAAPSEIATTAPVTTAAQPTAAPQRKVLFDESFDDDRNGWGIVDDPEYGSTAYEDGDYVWDFRGSVAHWLPAALGDEYDRGELEMADVIVKAEVTVVSGGGVVGVFCRENPDTDADWQWYEFVARNGFAAIRHADAEANLEVLAETGNVDLPVGELISLEASCSTDEDGRAQLSLSINGTPLLDASDDDPLGNGVPGIQAWTYPIHAPMDIRWHSFSIEATQL